MTPVLPLLLLVATADEADVQLLARPGPPWVEVRFALRGGAADDPKEKSGLAHVAATLLERRTGAHVRMTRRGLVLATGAVRDDAGKTATNVVEAITRPVTDKEVDAAVSTAVERRKRFVDHDRALAEAELLRVLFGAPNPLGSVEDLATITRDDVASFVLRHWSARDLRIVLAGDFDPSIEDRIRARSTRLERPAKDRDEAAPSAKKLEGIPVVLVDKPDRRLATILFGRAVTRTRAVEIADAALGGAPTALLAPGWSRLESDHWIVERTARPEALLSALTTLFAALGRLEKKGLEPEAIELGRTVVRARALLSNRDARASADRAARAWIVAEPGGDDPTDDAVTRAARDLTAHEGLAIVVVASATGDLQSRLARLPKVSDVQVVRYDLR